MSIWEINLIIILSILLLKPNEIQIVVKKIIYLISNINKNITLIKDYIIKYIKN